jgi:hypothetical protein
MTLGGDAMVLNRRVLLALSAATMSQGAFGQTEPPATAPPAAGGDEHVEIKVVIEAQYKQAELKLVEPRSGAVATTSPTETGKEMAFSGRLKKTGCITDYDCVVTPARNHVDVIRLWVMWTRDREFSLALQPHDYSATRMSLDQLERRVPKDNLGDAMQCYVGGRRVFAKLSESPANRHSNLAIGALRMWLVGALAAYGFDPGFGRDESLVQAVERFRLRADNDSWFRDRWDREFQRFPDLMRQFGLYKTMEFDLYGHIPKLIEANNLRAAGLIVEELLRRLDGTQHGPAVDLRSVSRDQLIAYQDSIRARAP